MKTKLRQWQDAAGDQAVKRFASGAKVFVTEACTGAGKTLHGCDVMRRLCDMSIADLVIIVTPSTATRKGWIEKLQEAGFAATDNPDYFTITDFDALVITYGAFAKLDTALFGSTGARPIYNGIAAVFDEYHHGENDASWGLVIAQIAQRSKASLFLSGTPWRSNGRIAVLDEHLNMDGQPYYQGDRVKADYAYTYAEDLAKRGDDRGTVVVRFAFHDSTFTNPDTGQTERLINPHLGQMSEEDRELWIEKAMASDVRIGKHVRTQGTVADYTISGNSLVRRMLNEGLAKLQEHRALSGHGVPVLLIVAQSIKEAKAIYSYVQDVLTISARPVRAALIVSDKESASHEITSAQEKCKGGLLDVIVSVGMVSEGVDIPQIKGVVFLSAIMTALYIIQVIGRLLRRIKINDRYIDSSVHHLPGFFIAPAAPKLCAIAYRIEQEIYEAAPSFHADPSGKSPEDLDRPDPVVGSVSTTGDVENVYRGSESNAMWRDAVDLMLTHELAEECHISTDWAQWVLSMACSGDTKAWGEARKQMQDRCHCLGIEMDDMFKGIKSVADMPNKTMPQKHKQASREAEVARAELRNRCQPYCDIDSHDMAYKMVNRDVAQRCEYPRSWSFTKATLEEKRRWIDVANQMKGEANR
jgi:superfamily II DNA or RNA helicase